MGKAPGRGKNWFQQKEYKNVTVIAPASTEVSISADDALVVVGFLIGLISGVIGGIIFTSLAFYLGR